MKTKLILCLLLPAIAWAAQGRPGPANAGPQRGQGGALGTCPADCPLSALTPTTPTTLSAADLVFGVEEERMARDLYRAAFERWQLWTFERIGEAETQHEAAFVRLAASANLTLPPTVRGVYATPELQRLYGELLVLVNESAIGALRAGALLEETDIVELRRMSAEATDESTRAVLANLERGTIHHLQAFVRNLARYGESYQPKVLGAADFAELIARGR